VAKPGHEDAVREIFAKWELEAVTVGRVTDDGRLKLNFRGDTVADIPVLQLADEAPKYDRPIAAPPWVEALQGLDVEALPEPGDYGEALEALLGSPTIASKELIFQQYDHMVRTNTVVLPGSDAAVLRIKGTDRFLALTVDCNSRYCLLNPYAGAAAAVAEAARNVVASGARPLGITDCLNFASPERPEVMWQFALAIEGIADACKALGTPVVSGNVSFYNETMGLGVYPTPAIGMVGLIENGRRPVSLAFQDDGDLVVVVGTHRDDLGGSEYLAVWHAREQGIPPYLDLEAARKVNDAVLTLMDTGCVKSCHDTSEGGLAVALAECAIAGGIGAQVGLATQGLRRDALLFGESQSRFVLTVAPANRDMLASVLGEAGVPFEVVGWVRGDRLQIGVDRTLTIDRPLAALSDIYRTALERALEGGP
jgi:phosphoribosylformylglycinamidine synthase II